MGAHCWPGQLSGSQILVSLQPRDAPEPPAGLGEPPPAPLCFPSVRQHGLLLGSPPGSFPEGCGLRAALADPCVLGSRACSVTEGPKPCPQHDSPPSTASDGPKRCSGGLGHTAMGAAGCISPSVAPQPALAFRCGGEQTPQSPPTVFAAGPCATESCPECPSHRPLLMETQWGFALCLPPGRAMGLGQPCCGPGAMGTLPMLA